MYFDLKLVRQISFMETKQTSAWQKPGITCDQIIGAFFDYLTSVELWIEFVPLHSWGINPISSTSTF